MRRILAALALCALPTVAVAQTPCVTAPEAEAITLVALPDIILETGRVCTALSAGSIVRRSSFIARFQAEADRAWPAARTAITKLADPRIEMLMMSDYARPLVTSLIAPQIVGRIQASDCPTIDRIVTLLEPLPPRNVAGIVVASLQHLAAEKARGGAAVAGVPNLPVCPAGRR